MNNQDFVLPFSANISLQELNRLVKQGTELLQTRSGGNLVLDLAEVPLINSLTIGSIIRLHNLYSQHGRRVILRNVSPDSRDMLVTTGLINVLAIETGGATSAASPAPARSASPHLSVKLDFEFHGEIGVFKFSGSMVGLNDSELCLKTVEKIVNDEYRMMLDISQLVPLEKMTDNVYRRLEASLIKAKGRIRIFCSDPVLFDAYRKRLNGSALTLYPSREDAMLAWEMGN
jgi:anti-anti-sigma regulatory factor